MIKIKKTNRCDTRTLAPGQTVSVEDAKLDTKYHIEAVQACGDYLMRSFTNQLRYHDHTKLENIEEFTEGLNKGFNSPEFQKWYNMHVHTERHHLLKNVPDDVDLIDVLEMICDCVSAGMARSGKVFDVEIPSEILEKAVANTVKVLIDNIEVEE